MAGTLAALDGLTWDLSHRAALLSLFSVPALLLIGLGLTALWVPGIAWGLVMLGAQYGAHLALDPAGTATWAPLFGAGLFLCAELAYLSLELRTAARPPTRGRLLGAGFLALGSAAAGEVLLLAVGLLPAHGFGLVVAGALAVGALLAGLAWLAGRTRAD